MPKHAKQRKLRTALPRLTMNFAIMKEFRQKATVTNKLNGSTVEALIDLKSMYRYVDEQVVQKLKLAILLARRLCLHQCFIQLSLESAL